MVTEFMNSKIYLSFALDWMIVNPRNFQFHRQKPNFLTPPISLWWVPMTNAQLGWAFNSKWLATLGLVYYWGLSTSARYRFLKHAFIETRSVVSLNI